MEITTIGLDIAKRVFQVHEVDATGKVVLRRKLCFGTILGPFKYDLPQIVAAPIGSGTPRRFTARPALLVRP